MLSKTVEPVERNGEHRRWGEDIAILNGKSEIPYCLHKTLLIRALLIWLWGHEEETAKEVDKESKIQESGTLEAMVR